jgi:pyrrolidone-carboxylate peptidase
MSRAANNAKLTQANADLTAKLSKADGTYVCMLVCVCMYVCMNVRTVDMYNCVCIQTH